MCSVKPGCYLPYDLSGGCEKYHWDHPLLQGIEVNYELEGCRIQTNEVTCQKLASMAGPTLGPVPYFFLSHSDWANLTENQCNNLPWKYAHIPYGFLTHVPVKTEPLWQPISVNSSAGIPPCAMLTTKWYPGQWISGDDQWLELEWKQRRQVPIVNYSGKHERTEKKKIVKMCRKKCSFRYSYSHFPEIIDYGGLDNLMDASFIPRWADILRDFILCKDGNMKDILLQISCLCGNDKKDHNISVCQNTRRSDKKISGRNS